MLRFALFCCAAFVFSGAVTAQEIHARTPAGPAVIQTEETGSGIKLAISISGLEPQIFEGVGDKLVPLRAGEQNGPVIALDIDRDGIDEIFVRTSAQGQRGVLLVFRWDAARRAYAPVPFTESTGAPKPYLLVHLDQPVTLNGAVIEANHDSSSGGRMRLRVFRYSWDGNGFTQTTDH